MQLLASLLPLLNSVPCVVPEVPYRVKATLETPTYFIEIILLCFCYKDRGACVVITFCEAMVDSQLHKISNKTLLEYFCVLGQCSFSAH